MTQSAAVRKEAPTHRFASNVRSAVVAVVPALVAFAMDWYFWSDMPVWSLLYPAIVLSAALGGLPSGVVSTVFSAALLWIFLIPPEGALVKGDVRYGISALIFIATGALLTLLFERIRQANRATQAALAAQVAARTDLEAANANLRAATEGFEEAQRVAHVGSWNFDLRGNSLEWSDEMFRIFGREPGTPVPRLHGPEQIYTPESVAALSGAISTIRKDGKPYEVELELIRPDGSTRLVAARGVATREPATGEIIGITGTAQDVTELRRLEQLREEWLSVIAHDLRQPIGAISMSADLLPDLHEGELSNPERTIIRRIGSAAHGLSRMVNDMLDASRIEAHRLALDRAWVDPAGLVRDTVESVSHIAAGVQIRVSADAHLPRVFADSGRVQQVLSNLISNAVKYGDRTSGIDVRIRTGAGDVEITVSNRGEGIAPEDVPVLFDRFERLKAARNSGTEGLGLGLYIARGIVEGHGGRIWCDSVPNETTAFHFTLPSRLVGVSQAA